MTTCVVTGGAGFLGSHLCEHLLGKGHRVICIDNLETGSLENIAQIRDEAFEFRDLDITTHVDIAEDVDFVYHLASPASPIDYLRLPLQTLKVGSHGTHHMLGVAKFKRARFLIASTSEVYGDPQVHPQKEDYWGHVNPIGPRGVYDEAKRYAEALTMAYHRQQGLDTAIVRIFNSVLADEQVLFDDGRELQRCTAGELSARLARFASPAAYARRSVGPATGGTALLEAEPSAAVEFPVEGFSVPSFTAGGRMVAAEPSGFIGHPTEQRCFEVSTRYGRSVKVTGDHSLFVEGPEGEPTPKPVNDLEIGDRIAIAGRIEVPERDRTLVSMIEVWRWAENDPLDLYAEYPGLGAKVWERRFDVFGLLAKLKPGEGRIWRNWIWSQIFRMRDSDRVMLPVLWRLGDAVPEGARVRARTQGRSVSMPAHVEITDDLLWLLGLYVAEGCMHEKGKNAFITISGEQELLERAAAVIERSFGLHVTWGEGSEDRAASIFVHSKLLLRFWDFLGLDHNRKRIPGWILGLPLSRLKWFIEGYREGDGVHSGTKFEEATRHEFSTVHEELKDDLIVAFARFGLVPSLGRYESTFRQRTGERRYPFWRLTLQRVAPWSPLDWDHGVNQTLQARRHGDLVWAPVREIEEVSATDLVYDFSVPGLENFWAGTGIAAANTYGPRMRPHDGRAIPTFLRQAL
ncbi:MAG TPA: NAD-dependent epimerase/dehydratase family protein, partial [Solirubrobacterales bacterium]|nr:NAD-dependent epimerase/dehydratase family protein [Solirubrobacterales bacterium]